MAWGHSNYHVEGVLDVTFEQADRKLLVRGSRSCRTCCRTLLLPCHTPLLILNTCLKCSMVSHVTSAEHLVGIVQYVVARVSFEVVALLKVIIGHQIYKLFLPDLA